MTQQTSALQASNDGYEVGNYDVVENADLAVPVSHGSTAASIAHKADVKETDDVGITEDNEVPMIRVASGNTEAVFESYNSDTDKVFSSYNSDTDEPWADASRKSLYSVSSSRSSTASLPMSYFVSRPYERRSIRHIMSSPKFDYLMGSIILSNCFAIGLEQSLAIEGKDISVLEGLEHIYLSIYCLELGLRFFGWHTSCLHDRWVQFDIFLVTVGVISSWIIQPFAGQVEQLGPVMVLRTGRLMRLARTLRLLQQFQELWMLVRGLLSSATTMIYTLLMLFVVIYVFSCMSIELVTNHSLAKGPDADPDFQKFVDNHFKNLPETMITLLQFATADSLHAIYLPLVRKSWWLAFFFVAIILVVSIVLMNLITAVIVNSALEQANDDKAVLKAQDDKRRKKMMKDLKKMFKELDDDGSGDITAEEITLMSHDNKQLLRRILGMSDPVEIFKQLDVDKSGSLEISEFIDGIWQVAESRAPIELKRIEKKVSKLEVMIAEIQRGLHNTLDVMQESIDGISADVGREKTEGPSIAGKIGEHVAEMHRCGEASGTRIVPGMHSQAKLALARLADGQSSLAKTGNGTEAVECLTTLRISIASDLDRLREALIMKLQEISCQLQPVTPSRKARHIVPLGEQGASWDALLRSQEIVALGDQNRTSSDAHTVVAHGPDDMLDWAHSFRSELLNAASSINVTLSTMPGHPICKSKQGLHADMQNGSKPPKKPVGLRSHEENPFFLHEKSAQASFCHDPS